MSRTAGEILASRRSALKLEGEILGPGDAGYDEARRLYNAAIDRRPALIARCAGASDVVAAVRFARENASLASVRGGGHGVAGHAICDGGLVIDVSPMRAIRVDVERRTARVEGGVLNGELDRATQAFGLATIMGNVSATGVAGLTLGGGLGFLMRSLGLACDNLLSVDLVTADARRVTASDAENPELFWGLRGGGGNFGVATSFEFRLHPVGPVLAGPVAHPVAAARELFRFVRDFLAAAPDELACNTRLARLSDGTPAAGLLPVWCGAIEKGEAFLRPLRAFGSPIEDRIAPMDYLSLQSMKDAAYPFGLYNYWTSCFLESLDDSAIDTLVELGSRGPTPMCHVVLETLGGAVGRVAVDATAFPHRRARFNCLILGMCDDARHYEACARWARQVHAALRPFSSGGAYVNYLGEDAGDGAHGAYGSRAYERLAAIKRKFDPENFFRSNLNVRPAA